MKIPSIFPFSITKSKTNNKNSKVIRISVEKLGKSLRVKDVMSTRVVTVDETSSAYDAVRKIMDHEIGCVVVVKDKIMVVVGIITKGDIMREVVMKKLIPEKVSAKEVMSHPALTTSPDTRVNEATSYMSEKNVSKLPVLKNGTLIGIITSTDLLRKDGPRKIIGKDLI